MKFSGILIFSVLVLSGCGRGHDDDFTAPIQKQDAIRLAYQSASAVGGKVYSINNANNSMAGVFSDHSFVVVIDAYERIKEGQIVMFHSSGRNLIHKVITGRDGIWRTKGSGNNLADADWVGPDNYVGTYIGQFSYQPQEAL